jgi:hypothetical protein
MMRKLTFLLSSALVSLPAFAQTPAPAAAPAAPAAPAVEAAPVAEPTPASPAAKPAEPKKHGGGPSLSLDPQVPQQGGLVTPTEIAPVEEPEPTSEWKFDVSGYTRAPLRMSWGPPTTADPRDPNPTGGYAAGTQYRTPAMVPDGNYVDWRYTNNMVGPWTELNFHYGNSRAKLTVQIASYNITDSGYRRLESQLGINQAFLTVNYPELFNDDSRLIVNIGGFTNRYGAAGRYDGGKYETYLFGRTHVVGETVTFEYDVGNMTLAVEEGFGAKIEPTPFYGAAADTSTPARRLPVIPIWDPYPGPVAQESTFVAHGHVGLVYKKMLLAGIHYINVFANDNERAGSYLSDMSGYGGNTMPSVARPSIGPGSERPSITIYGADLKLLAGFGDAYLGYAHLKAQNALYLQDAVETLHSYGGVQLRDNFFDRPGAPPDSVTGSIDTIEFQYVLSLGQLLRYPVAFWGDGPDLVASVFGMFNYVKTPINPAYNGIKKLKFGADLTYLPLPWFGIGGRYDQVEPNMDDSDQTFKVISFPRLIFKTAFVTHEQIIVQYSRYSYGATAASSQYPYTSQPGGAGLGADKNALQIAATLWF